MLKPAVSCIKSRVKSHEGSVLTKIINLNIKYRIRGRARRKTKAVTWRAAIAGLESSLFIKFHEKRLAPTTKNDRSIERLLTMTGK